MIRFVGGDNLKSDVKIMLLGITLTVFAIGLRCIFIGYESIWIAETTWTILPFAGIIISLFGFFVDD